MTSILPINIDNLLHYRGVESVRVEFKASWDEQTSAYQVLKSICAFANDLHNLNGGYIIIGIEERNGVAILPPKGLDAGLPDAIQKWIRGNCNRIDPGYQPIMSPEIADGKNILVIWAPGSNIRPHRAPDGQKGNNKYWVRIGAETVDAEKNGVLPQLLELTARVPFDSRRALQARLEDLRENKVREFLRDIRSSLLNETDAFEIYRRMRICVQVNGCEAPLNAGLLFFSDDPEKWFPGARIEVVQFSDLAGNVQEERIFRGPLHTQLRDCLNYMENLSTAYLEKQETDIQARSWVNYPIRALREALVNAVYHRGYEGIDTEPAKVYLYSDRIEIISYPGPVPGIQLKRLQAEKKVLPLPARNRRIGEFLKELRLAESRGTGLPNIFTAMRQNGSPEPQFDFDEDRTYFRVTLPVHPEYPAVLALRNRLKTPDDSKTAKLRPEPEFRPEVFISYARGGDNEEIVDLLARNFQKKGISIVRDKRDLGFKGRIKAFMEQIGRGKYVVIAVIDNKYLESENCMFEWMQIVRNREFYDRIFPVLSDDARIYKARDRIRCVKYWENEIKTLNEAMQDLDSSENLHGFREEIDLYTNIRAAIAELTELLRGMNTLTVEFHKESGFDELLKAVERKLAEQPKML
ncbi:MAG: TIR domain-containing protein [Gammaproteobacteria bacterium]|nr:TIR domain-containing protein [Gammaproteobacteria bacterium]